MTLYAIKDRDLYTQITADISNSPGCYVLCCCKGDGFFSINRILGVDDAGTLYIGSGTSLCQRIGSLRKALCAAVSRDGYTDRGVHGCELKYTDALQQRFPFDSLKVLLYPATSNEEAWRQEAELLAEYERRFGEAPPFNEGRPRARSLFLNESLS
jgi:hypothetical protein